MKAIIKDNEMVQPFYEALNRYVEYCMKTDESAPHDDEAMRMQNQIVMMAIYAFEIWDVDIPESEVKP